MNLAEAITAAGMTPPQHVAPGRFVRFPGAGKGRANRAGWLKVISPTLAVFGDWTTGLNATWRDENHVEDERSRKLLAQAQERNRRAMAASRAQAREAEEKAHRMILEARTDTHPYLVRKGFPHSLGLVTGDLLLVPIRAVEDYERCISMQTIAPDGTKRFLPGGRVKGGVHRLGAANAKRIALCEGFATGLSVHAAMKLLPGPCAVIVCFSAGNVVHIAPEFPGAIVCADRDESKAGEEAAKRTGLRWVMPGEIGDFNDLMMRSGLIRVVEMLRSVW